MLYRSMLNSRMMRMISKISGGFLSKLCAPRACVAPQASRAQSRIACRRDWSAPAPALPAFALTPL